MADEKTSTKASAAGQPSTTASIIANMDETDWKTMLMEMRVSWKTTKNNWAKPGKVQQPSPVNCFCVPDDS